MVWHGKECAGAIGIVSHHRDVVPFAGHSKAQPLKGSDHVADGGIDRELAHLGRQFRLSDEGLNHWLPRV